MQREIAYEFSPALVRLAARRFIVRYAGLWLGLSIPIMILGIAWLILGTDQSLWWLDLEYRDPPPGNSTGS